MILYLYIYSESVHFMFYLYSRDHFIEGSVRERIRSVVGRTDIVESAQTTRCKLRIHKRFSLLGHLKTLISIEQ